LLNKDVKRLCKDVLRGSILYIDNDYESRYNYYQCMYCCHESMDKNSIEHDSECPVLLAKNILNCMKGN